MGFFESLPVPPDPEPEPAPPPPPAWIKPEDVLPGSVGIELLLAHNDQGAVAVGEVRAYPTGFSFTLSAVTRESERSGATLDVMHGLRARPDRRELPDEFLRLGIEFADGTVVSNLGGRFAPYDEQAPEGPLLMNDGGGGGGRRYDMSYWVWPLPPAGPVTFVCAWPVVGIGESTATIDAAAIHAAAARAVMLWPEDREIP